VSISVTYTAVLDVKRSTAEHLAGLLRDHRIAAGTRRGRRALGCFRQAVFLLRWFIDGTRLSQKAPGPRSSWTTLTVSGGPPLDDPFAARLTARMY
jgi:hypothetical protein